MTREELKEHCKKTVEQCEMWAIHRGEEPSGKVYEEHKAILNILEQEPCNDAIDRADAQTEIMMSKSIVAFDRDLWIKTKDAIQILRALPSVQPSRKGHWIELAQNMFA